MIRNICEQGGRSVKDKWRRCSIFKAANNWSNPSLGVKWGFLAQTNITSQYLLRILHMGERDRVIEHLRLEWEKLAESTGHACDST